jgi:hypothetical protein
LIHIYEKLQNPTVLAANTLKGVIQLPECKTAFQFSSAKLRAEGRDMIIYKILVRKPEEKRPLGRPRCR